MPSSDFDRQKKRQLEVNHPELTYPLVTFLPSLGIRHQLVTYLLVKLSYQSHL